MKRFFLFLLIGLIVLFCGQGCATQNAQAAEQVPKTPNFVGLQSLTDLTPSNAGQPYDLRPNQADNSLPGTYTFSVIEGIGTLVCGGETYQVYPENGGLKARLPTGQVTSDGNFYWFQSETCEFTLTLKPTGDYHVIIYK